MVERIAFFLQIDYSDPMYTTYSDSKYTTVPDESVPFVKLNNKINQ